MPPGRLKWLCVCIPGVPKGQQTDLTKSRDRKREGVALWHTHDMETALPIRGPCAGGRMGDAEASPFQVGSGRGTGVNLAKMSGEEQVQEKEGPSQGEVWASAHPVLKRQPPALAHFCCTGDACPLRFLWIFMFLMLTSYSKLKKKS